MRPGTSVRGFAERRTRPGGNGLSDDTWVPVLSLDGRIVSAVLAETRRAGVQAYCARFSCGWHFPPRRGERCLRVDSKTYGRTQDRLAKVMRAFAARCAAAPLPREPGGHAVVVSTRGASHDGGSPTESWDHVLPPLRFILETALGMHVETVTVSKTLSTVVSAMARGARRVRGRVRGGQGRAFPTSHMPFSGDTPT